MFGYNFTWKKYRGDPDGAPYVKSEMVLSNILLQILQNLEILALSGCLSWVFGDSRWL